jgi:hypothetical protein
MFFYNELEVIKIDSIWYNAPIFNQFVIKLKKNYPEN